MPSVIIYIIRVILALSVLINVILGGKSNQTFSARNWEWKKSGKWNAVLVIDGSCVALAWIATKILTLMGHDVSMGKHQDHCMESWVWWYTHAQKHNCEDVIDRMEIKYAKEKGWKVKGFRFRRSTQQRVSCNQAGDEVFGFECGETPKQTEGVVGR